MSRRDASVLSTVGHELLGLSRKSSEKRHDLFFRKGWGDARVLEELSRAGFMAGPAKSGEIRWKARETRLKGISLDGTFESPLAAFLPGEAKEGRVRAYLPKEVDGLTPVYVLFAMTGEEGFKTRIGAFSRPLLELGIGTLLLENPYYGLRRDQGQTSVMLDRVQDMLTMSVAAVEEGKFLVSALRRAGFKRIGVAGSSQGGMVAAVVGCLVAEPLAVAISLAAHSPEVIFTEGLLRSFVDWEALGLSSPEEGVARFKALFGGGDVTALPGLVRPEAARIIGARRDLVVPGHSVRKIHQAWPGSRLSWLPGTHVTSLALHVPAFRRSLVESMEALSGR
ncbi:MAG: alpha/beta hydrolase family protein [Oligoflexia bacterium]|nr:alpha/beta hydrolase family protein [Oligoflexia bacterium]